MKPIFSMRKPLYRQRKNEGFRSAHRRYQARWAEYRDARVMAECDAFSRDPERHRKEVAIFRAFHGIEMKYIMEAGGW